MATRVLIINGPNLNLLGTREPQIYGSTTLADVLSTAESQAKTLGVTLETFQSNHEGAIVDRIQEAAGFGPNGHQNKEGKVSAIIINPGAYTHTSVAYVISIPQSLILSINLLVSPPDFLSFCPPPPSPPTDTHPSCEAECLDSALRNIYD
jgi:3-dehydroquinate dehydratase-2